MKTMNNKKLYFLPEITSIALDNEISLILTSQAPPSGPGESTTFEELFQSEETGNSPWE